MDILKNIFISFLELLIVEKKKYNINTRSREVMGVALSGKMFFEHVTRYIDIIIKYSDINRCDLELIFHPGGI